jgi:alkylation response protein AidB-like acyl-CoA dehydrogenase
MDFTVPDHIEAMRREVRRFVDTEVIPLEAEFLAGDFSTLAPLLEPLRATARAMGLWAAPLPESFGGSGMGLVDFAHLSEELGRTPLGHFVCNVQAPDIGNMELLQQFGTPEQQKRWLRPLVAGEIRSSFSMTEPGLPGSNPAWMATTARRDGDDWVIDGDKWFTTAGEGAAFTIIMAVTNPEAENRYLRASMILVPEGTPGYTIVRSTPVMGEAGSGWAGHYEVSFDGCRVPAANLIGGEGAGFALAQERLGPGRIHHTMRWIGIAERALDLMTTHAIGREVAPGTPLATRQTVQHWIADSRAEIDAARLMVLRTAWRIEREGSRAARTDISAIKYFVANVLQTVLDRAIQAHGALGVTDYTPLALWWRHERAARIYDGPDEVHRNVVARTELRKHGYGR